MTKKKSEEKPKEKTSASTKNAAEKLILFEAVQKHPKPNYVIVGALSQADLLQQYLAEEAVYGIEDITPSITMDDLNKIVKNFLGE